MIDLVLATRNRGKLRELAELLSGTGFQITSLADHPEIPEVVEDGATFLENARKKATAALFRRGVWALADDSGLVVEALGGEPGVHSARYAGAQGDSEANNAKLLREMRGVPNERRSAAFVCAMVLVAPDGREWSVEGRCEGAIGREPRGDGGFGFDPLFVVAGEGMTMAELPPGRKNEISHRGKALREVKEILLAALKEGR